jgi:hypothetical protein
VADKHGSSGLVRKMTKMNQYDWIEIQRKCAELHVEKAKELTAFIKKQPVIQALIAEVDSLERIENPEYDGEFIPLSISLKAEQKRVTHWLCFVFCHEDSYDVWVIRETGRDGEDIMIGTSLDFAKITTALGLSGREVADLTVTKKTKGKGKAA